MPNIVEVCFVRAEGVLGLERCIMSEVWLWPGDAIHKNSDDVLIIGWIIKLFFDGSFDSFNTFIEGSRDTV